MLQRAKQRAILNLMFFCTMYEWIPPFHGQTAELNVNNFPFQLLNVCVYIDKQHNPHRAAHSLTSSISGTHVNAPHTPHTGTFFRARVGTTPAFVPDCPTTRAGGGFLDFWDAGITRPARYDVSNRARRGEEKPTAFAISFPGCSFVASLPISNSPLIMKNLP